MRITLIALGTRGDVQPAVALALGLERAGHTVRLAAPPLSRDLVVSYGLHYAPLGGLPAPGPQISSLQTLGLILRGLGLYAKSLLARGAPPAWPVEMPYLAQLMEDSWSACQGAEVVVSPFVTVWVSHIVEKLSVPHVLWDTHPLTVTRAFPSFFFTGLVPGWLRLADHLPRWFGPGGGFNALTHRAVERLAFELGLRLTNAWRQQALGLPPLMSAAPLARAYRSAAAFLYCYSPQVLAEPEDWPPSHHATGYWFTDTPAGWQPAIELERFLAAGPPPVCVGFGSSRDRHPERVTEIVLAALARAGHRGIVLTGRGGMTEVAPSERVYVTDSVPHDWLFPRVAAVVHHAGAGTTGAVLRAGVPSVAVPWWGDMPFWADRLYRLGVSPRPIPKRRLSPARLAAAIRAAVDNGQLRARARAVATLVEAEDGVARAVEIIEASVVARAGRARE